MTKHDYAKLAEECGEASGLFNSPVGATWEGILFSRAAAALAQAAVMEKALREIEAHEARAMYERDFDCDDVEWCRSHRKCKNIEARGGSPIQQVARRALAATPEAGKETTDAS